MKKRKRLKKMISLLTAFALLFSLNSLCFAEEVQVDEEVAVAEEVSLISGDLSPYPSGIELSDDQIDVMPEQMKILSDNWDSLSENLNGRGYTLVKGSEHNFLITYPRAIGLFSFEDKKNTVNSSKVKVYLFEKSVSDGDINTQISMDKVGINLSDNKIQVKKMKVKSSKGATVDIEGHGIVPANKCTYISKLTCTFDYDKKKNKVINKEFKKALKTYVSKVKKDKITRVSANGCKEGGTFGNEDDMIPLVIAVYPAYAGNGLDRSHYEYKNNLSAVCEKLYYSASGNGAPGLSSNKFGSLVGGKYIEPEWVKKISGTKILKRKTKYGIIKSVKMSVGRKKITLKPDKNGKKLGFIDGGEEFEVIYTYNNNKYNYKYARVETDGNCFGTVYIQTSKNKEKKDKK